MSGFMGFLGTIFQLLFFGFVVLGGIALWGYNKLRSLSEGIREAWSNIGVTARKQVSLTNQLIEIVRGYQESEKLVMLKVSEDASTAGGIAQMHQQAGMVVSAISGMAQKFPELKANQQYQQLIESIQSCEAHLERVRQTYNASVKQYNIKRSSIPHVLYASTLGFKAAPYLEFSGEGVMAEMGELKSFAADVDGERLSALFGAAGASAVRLGNRALSGGKVLADAAQERAKLAIEAHNAKSRDNPEDLTWGSTDIEPHARSGTEPIVK